MSDIDLNAISAERPLSDIHKDRIRPPIRKPATKRPRRGSDNDVIDSAPEPTEVEANTSNEETKLVLILPKRNDDDAFDAAQTPTDPEAEPFNAAEQLISPKRVLSPMNPLQANLVMDIKNAIRNRKLVKSESNITEIDDEPKKNTEESTSIEKTNEIEPVVHNPIKIPGLMSELQRNIRVRPKTMDLGDLNILQSLARKKSPAPLIPKILESEVLRREKKVSIIQKEIFVQETKVSHSVKQESSIITNVQSPKCQDIPDPKVLLTTPSKLVTRVDKKQLIEKEADSKMAIDDGSQSHHKVVTIKTIQKSTEHKLQDIQEPSRILVEKTSSSKSVSVTMPFKDVKEEANEKPVEAKTSTNDKVDKDPKDTLDKAVSSEIIVSKNAIGSHKKRLSESSISSIQKIAPKLEQSKRLRTYSEETTQNKEEKPKFTPIHTKPIAMMKNQNALVNPQKTTISGKLPESLQTPFTRTAITTANDEKIKNATDNLSNIKPINPHITTSNREIPQNNLTSGNSKSMDKIATNSLIKSNTFIDKKAVREVTDDLMEKNYQIFKTRKENNESEVTSTKNILASTSTQSKAIKMNDNLETNETKSTEIASVTNIKKNIESNEIKLETIDKALTITSSEVKDLDRLKNQASKNMWTKKSQDLKIGPILNPSLESTSISNPKKIVAVDNNYKLSGTRADLNRNNKPAAERVLEKENISVITKVPSAQEVNRNTVSNKTTDVPKLKSISQVEKHAITTNKFLPRPALNIENVKIDTSKTNKNDTMKSDLSEVRFKNVASWIKNSSVELKPEIKTVRKQSDTNSNSIDNGKIIIQEDVKSTKAGVKIIDSSKFSIDTQSSLTKNTLSSSVTSALAVKKIEEIQSSVKGIEIPGAKSTTRTNSDNPLRRIETRFGSKENIFATSTSKENLSSSPDTYTTVSTMKFQNKSTISGKVEFASVNPVTVENSSAQTKSDTIVNKFLERNNINNITNKSKLIENLNSNNDQNSSDAPKLTDSQNNPPDNKMLSKNEIATTTSTVPTKESDPFGANRRNNIFRQQSYEQKVLKESMTSEVKDSNTGKETKDIKIGDQDKNDSSRLTWRHQSMVTSQVKEKEVKLNASAVSSTQATLMNISRSSEIKKELTASLSDTNQNVSSKLVSETTSPSDITIKDNTTKPSDFAASTKISSYNDLLKRTMNTYNKLSPDKEEPPNKMVSEKIGIKEEKITTVNKEVPLKVNATEKNINVGKWKRPDTLKIQKEEPKATTDKSGVSHSASSFLQGNKISRSIFENVKSSSASNTVQKSTPTTGLPTLPESEPIGKHDIIATSTKSIESPSTPPNQSKISPASRHESPIFNQIFLPKATFRSPTSSVNKSTEDLSITTRNSNSFRQNRAQTLSGNEHITIKRTISAAPIVDKNGKEKNESGTVEFLKEWRNRKKVNS